MELLSIWLFWGRGALLVVACLGSIRCHVLMLAIHSIAAAAPHLFMGQPQSSCSQQPSRVGQQPLGQYLLLIVIAPLSYRHRTVNASQSRSSSHWVAVQIIVAGNGEPSSQDQPSRVAATAEANVKSTQQQRNGLAWSSHRYRDEPNSQDQPSRGAATA